MRVGVVAEPRTRELRRAVLRPHLGPDDPLPGDDLPCGVHIGAVDDDGMVVGTCFVYPDPCPWLPESSGAWRLRQMATAPQRRGEGIGAAVLEAAVAHVRHEMAPLIWCNARETAVAFYAAHGFRKHGELFMEHGIAHLGMWRQVGEPDRAPDSSSQ